MASFPIVVDPFDYDQIAAVLATLELLEHFARENSLSAYTVEDERLGRYFGLYRPLGRISYDSKRCLKPVKTPGYAWSYTGYKSDRTAPGVLAHEMGHHVWECLCGPVPRRRRQRKLFPVWSDVIRVEAAVTSYGNIPEEDFAETLRIFILNPDLLRTGRPQRYELLTQLGLKPAFDMPWRDILLFAHDKFISAAESWIKKR